MQLSTYGAALTKQPVSSRPITSHPVADATPGQLREGHVLAQGLWTEEPARQSELNLAQGLWTEEPSRRPELIVAQGLWTEEPALRPSSRPARKKARVS